MALKVRIDRINDMFSAFTIVDQDELIHRFLDAKKALQFQIGQYKVIVRSVNTPEIRRDGNVISVFLRGDSEAANFRVETIGSMFVDTILSGLRLAVNQIYGSSRMDVQNIDNIYSFEI